MVNLIHIFVHFAGLKEEAKWYLNKFSWGHSFIKLNEELLEKYSTCKTSKDVLTVQDEYLQRVREEKANRRHDLDFPPSSTSEESESDGDTAAPETDTQTVKADDK